MTGKCAVPIAVVLLVAVSLSVQAKDPVVAAPAAKVVGEVSYVSGGIGDEEELAMQGVAGDYPLRLAFTSKGTGEYLAGVQVTLKDHKGALLLDAQSEGPCLFARLPEGHYTLQAVYEGKAQKRTFEIKPHAHVSLLMRWALPKDGVPDDEQPADRTDPEEPAHSAHGCWR
ncbi:MAG: hypothetical protein KGI67_07810 [Pseudomonadota bacterium]|nr:hypothetical protein [Pseudomonadota bacterium]